MRILREARGLARLNHPSVVTVYDVGIEGNEVFLAMELVEGVTLAQWLSKETRSWREVVAVMQDAASGLAAAHDAGLVHRDFKPQNVMVTTTGDVKVVDFGLVREAIMEEGGEHSASEVLNHPVVPMTVTGVLVGTPAYTSPEQLKGLVADQRSDVFAYCVTFYEALYGRRPFESKTVPELIQQQQSEVAKPENMVGPHSLFKLICRGLHPNSEHRIASMHKVVQELRSVPRRRTKRVALAALGLALVGGGVGLMFGTNSSATASNCDVDTQLGGAWNEDKRAELRHALEGEGQSDSVLWGNVEELLDRQAVLWNSIEGNACRAARVEKRESEAVFARRRDCLNEQGIALAAIMEILVAEPKAAKEYAIAMLSGPTLLPCGDDAKLLMSIAPYPDDSSQQDLEAARRVIARADALRTMGRLDESLQESKEAVELAKGLNHRPTEASALFSLGGVLGQMGHLDEADKVLRQASTSAAAGGDSNLEASSLLQLAMNAGARGMFESAQERSDHAIAVIERMGGNQGLSIHARSLRATFFYEQDQLEKAVEELGAAMAQLDELEVQGPNYQLPLTRVDLLETYGLVYDSMGEHEEALDYHQKALLLREEVYGDHHPHIAVSLSNIADLLDRLERPEEARPLYARAVAIHKQAGGPDNEYAAELTLSAAETDPQKRMVHLRRTIELAKEIYGDEHSRIVQPMVFLGGALAELKQNEEAVEVFVAALAMEGRIAGKDPGLRAYALFGLLGAYVDEDKLPDALSTCEELVALAEERIPDVLESARIVQAGLLLRMERWSDALAIAEKALPRVRVDEDYTEHDVAFVEFVTLAAKYETGLARNRANLKKAREARALYLAGPEPEEIEIKTMDWWLARVGRKRVDGIGKTP
jgi:tetratricopeptide (TPR) repeat protein